MPSHKSSPSCDLLVDIKSTRSIGTLALSDQVGAMGFDLAEPAGREKNVRLHT